MPEGGAPLKPPPPGLCQSGDELCCSYDDLQVATFGLHQNDIWLTRLRAELPVAALTTDLKLEPHPSQTGVSNLHTAQNPPGSGPNGASIAPRKRSSLGTGIVVVGAMLFVSRMLKRRRRA